MNQGTMPYLTFFTSFNSEVIINFQESGVLKPASYFMPHTNKQYSIP